MVAVAHSGGCCHPPLADSASCVPPIPDHHTAGSIEKINVVQIPQDDEIILHPPFRRQIAKVIFYKKFAFLSDWDTYGRTRSAASLQ